MRELIDRVRRSLPQRRPAVVGVGGAVAVGKTMVADALGDGLGACVISTDAFLYPNAVLSDRDLLMRKGYPESYDAEALDRTFARIMRGEPAIVPVYSHAVYDITEERETIPAADIVVIEGVVALQDLVRPHVDVAIYVEAPETVVRTWFVDRFLRLTREASDDVGSFYHSMSSLETDRIREIAEMTWDAINSVNLKKHIAPSRANAQIVVEKAPDHSIVRVSGIDGR